MSLGPWVLGFTMSLVSCISSYIEETVYLHPQYIGKIGVVQDFTTDGDVVVEYRDRSWRYNSAALTKVMLA